MDAFLQAASGELGSYISELLHEIFKGGPSITLSLKDEQLWKMLRLMFIRGKETSSMTIVTLMDTFQDILLVRAK